MLGLKKLNTFLKIPHTLYIFYTWDTLSLHIFNIFSNAWLNFLKYFYAKWLESSGRFYTPRPPRREPTICRSSPNVPQVLRFCNIVHVSKHGECCSGNTALRANHMWISLIHRMFYDFCNFLHDSETWGMLQWQHDVATMRTQILCNIIFVAKKLCNTILLARKNLQKVLQDNLCYKCFLQHDACCKKFRNKTYVAKVGKVNNDPWH